MPRKLPSDGVPRRGWGAGASKGQAAESCCGLGPLEHCGIEAGPVVLMRSCLATAMKNRPPDAGLIPAAMTSHRDGVREHLKAAGLAQAQPETRTASEHMHRHQASALAAVVKPGVWRLRLKCE